MKAGSKQTVKAVTPLGEGTVLVTHSQTVRQSHNYNSAECSYGVQLVVEDSDHAIRKAQARLERLVETPLNSKVAEHRARLEGAKEE